MGSPDASSGEIAGKYWDTTFCVSPAFPRQHGLPSVRSHYFLKAKFMLCGLVFFEMWHVTEYFLIYHSELSIQPSSLRNWGGLVTLLSSAGLYCQQLSSSGFWWREEKKTAFTVMFSGFLLVLSLLHSTLQLAGECFPLPSHKGVCESASMPSGISGWFMALWQCLLLLLHYVILVHY